MYIRKISFQKKIHRSLVLFLDISPKTAQKVTRSTITYWTYLSFTIMGRKRSSKNRDKINYILDEVDTEMDQSTTRTPRSHDVSTVDSTQPSNNNTLISTVSHSNVLVSTSDDDSNSTNLYANTVNKTSLSKDVINNRTTLSQVWLYAKKSDDSKTAACQLCDYVCSCSSHSTSTIRHHLITKHKKTDLVLNLSSNHSTSNLPKKLKKELKQLCYYAIIKDSRSFNDLNKDGIRALFHKLCPGKFIIL
jgi:hypothetical protein